MNHLHRQLLCALTAAICLTAMADDADGALPACGVPRIDIVTKDSVAVTNKTDYIPALLTFQTSDFRLQTSDFPHYPLSFIHDPLTSFHDSVYIRGRGNTSWRAYPKKSYRLKLFHRQALFGDATRHYVLIANYLDPTLAINATAMEAARLVGSAFAGHAMPVELYLNGDYLGSYMLTEKIRVGKGSVDIDQQRGVLVELDVNYDEPRRFVSRSYHLPVMVHHPEDSVADDNLTSIAAHWNDMEDAVRSGSDLAALVDTAALVRYLFVYDLFCNNEVGHPKSVFCFYERPLHPDALEGASPIAFGPVWDFDWSCGYLGDRYFELPFLEPYEQGQWFSVTPVTDYVDGRTAYNGYPFFDALVHHPQVKMAYARFCRDMLSGGLPGQLLDFIDGYASLVHLSAEHDATLWPNTARHASATDELKRWLTARAERLLQHSRQMIEDDIASLRPFGAMDNYQLPIINYPVFTLDGRPLSPAHAPNEGIYIVNRRKVIVK